MQNDKNVEVREEYFVFGKEMCIRVVLVLIWFVTIF